MPFRNTEFEPEVIARLDRCLARAQAAASDLGMPADGEGLRTIMALALIEATNNGEDDEDRLTDFALQALPSYRRLRQAR
ncbi:hypothetical protein ACO2RV_14545 [Ancylobacter sp. VNQ12]|uniref:hypothetical protein n=1 Tax=Ancylobacter sp. VNQ12 TaxID=3400920 RepID=UPI003C0B34B0